MLPIEFKEKILDGTMCAFVSKNVEITTGEFYFYEENDALRVILEGNLPYIVSHDIDKLLKEDIIEEDAFNNIFPYNRVTVIAKAECVGVNKFKNVREYKDIKNSGILEFIFDAKDMGVYVLPADLGLKNNLEVINHCKTLLGDTLKGYLHIFKLVKDN